MQEKDQHLNEFSSLGIAPSILGVLREWKFNSPTPIQARSIPVAVRGDDIVGIAQTGTGKTLAFGIPMIQRLGQIGGRGLILLPTRELASQVNDCIKSVGGRFGLRTAVLIGGQSKNIQIKALRQKPHIIVATPGRLIDHIKCGAVKLNDVKILVLDEADMMFDIGFAPQIHEILKSVPTERQTMLFSATMPPEILSLVARHMKLPVSIEVAPSGTPAEKVNHEMVVITKEDRLNQLKKTLTVRKGSVLIFCRTKHAVKKLTASIKFMGHAAVEIHSNRSLGQRTQALSAFKKGQARILVATDIAARGIDVKGIELVLNYDLPENAEDYVHRIGRTGRAGNTGQAISFVSPTEMSSVEKIERLIKKSILLTKLAEPVYGFSPPTRRSRHNRSYSRPTISRAEKISSGPNEKIRRGQNQRFSRSRRFGNRTRKKH